MLFSLPDAEIGWRKDNPAPVLRVIDLRDITHAIGLKITKLCEQARCCRHRNVEIFRDFGDADQFTREMPARDFLQRAQVHQGHIGIKGRYGPVNNGPNYLPADIIWQLHSIDPL